MSGTIPKPQLPAGKKASVSLVDALLAEAAARSNVNHSDERIAAALGCDEIQFGWQGEDFEAEFKIHYRAGQLVEIMAVELLQIDYRTPTMQQRTRYEEALWQELNEFGELRHTLESCIWEQSSSPG